MSDSERRTEDLSDKLILDIKSLVLLQGTDVELQEVIRRKLAGSTDESVMKFVQALHAGEPRKPRGLLFIALGELVLASLLVLAGTIVLVPTLAGVNTPAGLIQYFVENTYGGLGNSPLGPYVSAIEFALGALLMGSAFYALRQAAVNLKETGLTVKPGD